MFRRAVRRPSFWANVLVFVFVAILFAIPFGSLRGAPTDPAAVPIDLYWRFVGFVVLQVAMLGFVTGVMFLIFAQPVTEIVFPAPLRRSALLQHRARSAIRIGTVGSLVASGIGGLVLARFVAAPAWLFAARLFLVTAPALLFWYAAAALLAYGYSRIPSGRRPAAGAAALVAFLAALIVGLPSIGLLDGLIFDDPLFVLVANALLPSARVVGGFPLSDLDLAAMTLYWLAALTASLAVWSWPYDFHADTVTTTPPGEALSRERAPTIPWLRELRVRLRPGYWDLGTGAKALLGRNLTAIVRFPFVLVNGLLVGLVLVLLIPISLTSRFPLTSVEIVGATGLILAGMVGWSSTPLFQDPPEIRLGLPLRRTEFLAGYGVPSLLVSSALAALFGLITAAGGAPPAASLLVAGSAASFGLVSTGVALNLSSGQTGTLTGTPLAMPLTPGLMPMFGVMVLGMIEGSILILPRTFAAWYALAGPILIANALLGTAWLAAAAVRRPRPPAR